MSDKQLIIYGRGVVEYKGGLEVEAVTMGDGSTLVSGLAKDENGFVGITFHDGCGDGIGVERKVPPNTKLGDIEPASMMIRFNNPHSIDVVVNTLLHVKKLLGAGANND